jgi:hypothetical protein
MIQVYVWGVLFMETNTFNTGKRYNNIITFILYTVCPLVVYFVIFSSFVKATELPTYVCHYYGTSIGFSIGLLVYISMAIAGLFKNYFYVEGRRIKSFFFDIKISLSYAFSELWEDVKSNGIWLHMFLWVTIIYLILSVDGFAFLIELYNI